MKASASAGIDEPAEPSGPVSNVGVNSTIPERCQNDGGSLPRPVGTVYGLGHEEKIRSNLDRWNGTAIDHHLGGLPALTR